SVAEIIDDGLLHLGTFHVKKPLRRNRKKGIISENFQLLYFYHNRLENYGLHKVVTAKKMEEAPEVEILD
ncbi:MAG: hypothetical protein AAF223_05310, partial [Bacteroidota bacterium]